MPTEFLPGKMDLRELFRPWKLFTFIGGMAWLIYGALNYGIADGRGISLLMAA